MMPCVRYLGWDGYRSGNFSLVVGKEDVVVQNLEGNVSKNALLGGAAR